MVGTNLIPLNVMDKDSDLYKNHAKKYIGREDLMRAMIPKLQCKWNDVVQFSALDPRVILKAIKPFDTELKILRREYFKVHIEQVLSKHEIAIFNRMEKPKKGDFTINEEEVVLMNHANYAELKTIPAETIQYWKWAKMNNEKLLWFPGITHILIKGIVNTESFETCVLGNEND